MPGAPARKMRRFLAGHRRTWPVRLGAKAARWYLWGYENSDYDIQCNGELWLLTRLSSHLQVAFDIGANVGDWTQAVHSVSPSAEVHCFEIVPETRQRLVQRFSTVSTIHVAQVGLFDAPGEERVYFYPDASTVSSLVAFPRTDAREPVSVTVSTGDLYCDEMGVERIDLLKVDTEGTELSVLRGFERRLADRRIAVIQFEYGLTSIVTHELLKDFFEYLSPFGYRIGKLYPNYVDFRAYDLSRHEDFIGPNYVAVLDARNDLQSLLT